MKWCHPTPAQDQSFRGEMLWPVFVRGGKAVITPGWIFLRKPILYSWMPPLLHSLLVAGPVRMENERKSHFFWVARRPRQQVVLYELGEKLQSVLTSKSYDVRTYLRQVFTTRIQVSQVTYLWLGVCSSTSKSVVRSFYPLPDEYPSRSFLNTA